MNSRSLNRREFLAITAVLIETACLGWPVAAAADNGVPTPVDLSLLSKKIGENYLSIYPMEKDLPRLKQTLHFTASANAQQIKAQLRDDIHADFAASRTFRFAGWVFSRTEGRLAAYNYLTN